ncbi:acyl carrier protein [Pokkaliibacter sp. CJK22405]|uniref:acyl carrier protein n=1 Tax=Pokkaliibacter sp. CJK22405 TaxID=3384615 RepID=UPI00398492E1
MNPLIPVLVQQFPDAQFDHNNPALAIGSFPAWDSLGHFNLMLLIEQEYDVRFEPEELTELKSLSQIESALKSKGVSL